MTLTKKQIDKKKEIERKQAIEAYWEDHKEEKRALEDELSQLQNEKLDLEKQKKVYSDQEAVLRTESKTMVPAAERKMKLKEEIEQLKTERNNLGMFKIKEKKSLEQQIAELNKKVDSLEPEIKEQEAKHQKEYEMKIEAVLTAKKPITDKIKTIEERIGQIEKELSKDR